jgi:hypothetical protein
MWRYRNHSAAPPTQANLAHTTHVRCFDKAAAPCGSFVVRGREPIQLFDVEPDSSARNRIMSTLLLIILVLLVIGALPNWGYSRGWGYFPSGGLGLVLLILLILVLMGRI